MYALVTADGFLLETVDGPLDRAVAQARELGAREVIFDESYDISELFTKEIQRLQRAANPKKSLERAAKSRPAAEIRRPLRGRLDLIADPGILSADAQGAIETFERTGKFPKAIKRSVAVEILREATPAVRLQAAGVFSELDPAKAPTAAWAAVNRMRIDHDAVQRMSEREAFDRLRPIIQRHWVSRDRKQRQRYADEKSFLRPTGRGEQTSVGLLGTNHKMMKGASRGADLFPDGGAVNVMGLSILPHRLWQIAFGGVNPKGAQRRRTMPVVNTCIGASPECAQSCLVYSGQNTDRANDVKALRQDMLFADPEAFARLLQTSIEFHVDETKRQSRLEEHRMAPFVRLNVFSDIPWELVWPELFDEFPKLGFYDYTKVPGRVDGMRGAFPKNYDLTFSWSGINRNNAQYEWKHGAGKVTIVFFKKPGDKSEPWRTNEYWRGRIAKKGEERSVGPFPRSFLGMPIIDGDLTDVRPYDKYTAQASGIKNKPWIVGLRYKPPANQAFDPWRSLFVVPVEYWDGQIVAAVIPRDQPGVMQSVLQEAAQNIRFREAEKIALAWAKEQGQKLPTRGRYAAPVDPGDTMTFEGRRRLKAHLKKR